MSLALLRTMMAEAWAARFDPGTPVSLHLLDTRRRTGSDNVLLRYEVAG
jgi:hypothetical protein